MPKKQSTQAPRTPGGHPSSDLEGDLAQLGALMRLIAELDRETQPTDEIASLLCLFCTARRQRAHADGSPAGLGQSLQEATADWKTPGSFNLSNVRPSLTGWSSAARS